MKDYGVKTQLITVDGNEYVRVTLAGTDFDLPFLVLGGKKVGFLDVSGQVLMNEKAADVLVEKLKDSGIKFDTILNPVAKSNALAHAIAVRWAAQVDPSLTYTVVARKAKPGDKHAVEASYRSVTTSVEQTMYLTDADAAFVKGKNVLMVDDVYGAGGTTKALRSLLEQAGANIVGHAVEAVEQGGDYPDDLIYLYELPVI